MCMSYFRFNIRLVFVGYQQCAVYCTTVYWEDKDKNIFMFHVYNLSGNNMTHTQIIIEVNI